MLRQFLLAGLMLAVAACNQTPMKWERSRGGDAGRDEADCRAHAQEEAIADCLMATDLQSTAYTASGACLPGSKRSTTSDTISRGI